MQNNTSILNLHLQDEKNLQQYTVNCDKPRQKEDTVSPHLKENNCLTIRLISNSV